MKTNRDFSLGEEDLGHVCWGGRDQDSPGIGLKWSYESVRKFDCAVDWRNFGTARQEDGLPYSGLR